MSQNKGPWVTASGTQGTCVQVRRNGDQVEVGDTKDPVGATLTFTRDEWEAFTGGVRRGVFDDILD